MLEKIEQSVKESFMQVTGICEEELREISKYDFMESDILDSLAIVTMISLTEKKIGQRLPIGDFEADDFKNIESIIKATKRILSKH